MSCCNDHRTLQMDQYLDGTLEAEARDEFEDHYFNCEACFEELRFRQNLKELIKAEGRSIFPGFDKNRPAGKPKRSGKVRFMVYAALAAAILLMAVIYLASIFKPETEPIIADDKPSPEQRDSSKQERGVSPVEDPVAEQQPDPVRKTPEPEKDPPPKPQLIAANFEPSPNLEGYIDNNTRRSHCQVAILAPENGINIDGDALFQWQANCEEERYLVILNNRENELFEFTVSGHEHTFENASGQLEPGLYYWKLDNEEETLVIGKFFVGKE